MRGSNFLKGLLCSTLLLTSAHSLASNPMSSIFSGMMSNSTSGGSFENRKTMGWSGGSYSYRVPNISTPNIISFVPPKANVGCNGADFFLGSFSIINKDELVQIMRGIANGSAAFAFSVAMDAVCPTCIKEMQQLEGKLDKLNQAARNSCQTTLTALNNTLGPAARAEANRVALIKPGLISKGIFSDGGEADSQDQTTVTKKLADTTAGAAFIKENVSANLTYEALTKMDVPNWTVTGATSYSWTELLMSLFGTVVLKYDTNNEDMVPTPYPPTISLSKLVDGASTGETIRLYKCAATDTGCLSPVSTADTSWQGLHAQMETQLATLWSAMNTKNATTLASLSGLQNMFPSQDLMMLERSDANTSSETISMMADNFSYLIAGLTINGLLDKTVQFGVGTKSTVADFMPQLLQRRNELKEQSLVLSRKGQGLAQQRDATSSFVQRFMKMSGLK